MAGRTARGQVAGPTRPRAGGRSRDLLAVAALAVGAAALRVGPLGPSSLWLDDAWTALVVRADSWTQAADLMVTAPGFGVLLRAWLAAVGFTETAAQLPAFAFAVLGPPVVYLVATRAGAGRVAGGAGGLLLLLAPAHLTVATRVKQYSLDALLAAVLIALAWRVLSAPHDRARWGWFVACAVVATVLSAATAPVIAAGLMAGVVAAWREGVSWRPGVVATGAYAVAGLGWYLAVVRPSVSPALREYWREQYIDLSAGPSAAATDLVRGLAGVLQAFSALPPLLTGLVLLAAVVLVVWRRPAVGLLLVGPVAVAVALAALGLAPLGGGRTDVVLLPGLALLAAVAIDCVGGVDRRVGAVVALVVVVSGAVTGPTPAPYPDHDVRPLVAEMEARLAPGDVVLVYSAARWAYGLYTGFAVGFPDDPSQPTGFDVAVADPRVRILPPQRDDPQRYAPDVRAGTHGAQRVWLLASAWRDDLAVLERLIADQGLRPVERRTRPGGLLVRWER